MEMDSAMMPRSLNDDSPPAVFLDVAAAFPSISQEYIQAFACGAWAPLPPRPPPSSASTTTAAA
eukprot:8983909-Pyramimonas_sp.AAC.1